MKLGVLFSGGKDSTLALHLAAQFEEVACLITLVSLNKESYMFHTPNIEITKLQAKALRLPMVMKITEGRKETELKDLERAVELAISRFKIEGIVTGAVESVYQSTRIQRLSQRLSIWCFNPLWKRNQIELLKELLEKRFKVIISGVFAYPLDKNWLGKEIDQDIVCKLAELEGRFGISPSGEGGEIETTVLDAPLFNEKIDILNHRVEAKGNSGVFSITKARLSRK